MAADITDLRELVRDPDENVFSDEALLAAVDASGDSILRAAGIAFQALAAEYSVTGRSIATDDLKIDTKGRGADLLQVAKSFFASASALDADAASDFFAIVPLGGRAGGSCVRPEGAPRPACCGGPCGGCVL